MAFKKTSNSESTNKTSTRGWRSKITQAVVNPASAVEDGLGYVGDKVDEGDYVTPGPTPELTPEQQDFYEYHQAAGWTPETVGGSVQGMWDVWVASGKPTVEDYNKEQKEKEEASAAWQDELDTFNEQGGDIIDVYDWQQIGNQEHPLPPVITSALDYDTGELQDKYVLDTTGFDEIKKDMWDFSDDDEVDLYRKMASEGPTDWLEKSKAAIDFDRQTTIDAANRGSKAAVDSAYDMAAALGGVTEGARTSFGIKGIDSKVDAIQSAYRSATGLKSAADISALETQERLLEGYVAEKAKYESERSALEAALLKSKTETEATNIGNALDALAENNASNMELFKLNLEGYGDEAIHNPYSRPTV